MNFSRLFACCLIAFSVLALFACTAYQRVTPVSRTFLEDVDVSKKIENLPFQHSWVRPSTDPYDFEAIFIKPVRIDKLPPDAWMTSASTFMTSRDDYMKEALELSRYFHQQIREKLRMHSGRRFALTDRVGPGVAVMEVAFTELEFSHPVAKAGALAVPVPGSSAALSTIVDPHAAIAVRLTDARTGKLIATIADRKFSPIRVLDLNKLTVTSTVREICSFWAEELANSIQEGRFSKVESVGTVRVLPW